MKIDGLGHTALVVRAGGLVIAVDPLLHPTFAGGRLEVYPPREVDLDGLPAIDLVVVTGADPERADLASLALLPRSTPVLAAAEPLLLGCLEGLGFTVIEPLVDWTTFTAGTLEITPTPGGAPHAHGLVVRDGDALTAWHLGAAPPDDATIAAVRERFGAIDLLLAPWQPVPGGMSDPSGRFPHARYAALVAAIVAVAPRRLIPVGGGARAIGPAAWTDRLRHPQTLERFLRDIAAAVPALAEQIHVQEPGDAISVTRAMCQRERGLSRCCRRTGERMWHELALRPRPADLWTADPRGEAMSRAQCFAAIEGLFEELARAAAAAPERLAEHRRWRVVWSYEVVFGDGVRETWALDLGGEAPALLRGGSPLACSETLVTAGLLIELLSGACAWDEAEASGELLRRAHTYQVDALGLRRPRAPLADPLALLLGGADAREERMAAIVEELRAALERGELRELTPAAAPAVDGDTIARAILAAVVGAGLDLPGDGA